VRVVIFIPTPDVRGPNAQRCIESVKVSLGTAGLDHYDIDSRMVICDNGWSRTFSHTQEINRIMIGWGSDAEALVLIDDDCFIDPLWFKRAIDATIQEPRGGVFGSRIITEVGAVHHAGGVIKLEPEIFPFHRVDESDHVRASMYVTSAACLITRRAFMEVGAFDAEYRKFYQEVDFSLKAWEKGLESYYVPSMGAVHLVGATINQTGRTGEMDMIDRATFTRKWKETGRLMTLFTKYEQTWGVRPNGEVFA